METLANLLLNGDDQHYYQCDTPRIGALTKLILEQSHRDYLKVITSTDNNFGERYYIEAETDDHWRKNEVLALELKIESDGRLKARFDFEVAIRKLHFEERSSHQ